MRNIITHTARSHIAIMLIILMLFMFHYYNFSIQVSFITHQHYLHPQNFLEYVFILAPFTFSSLFSPIGGLISAKLQKYSTHYIFPFLFLIDSILSILSYWIIDSLPIHQMLYWAMVMRMSQGILMGAIVPQFVIFFYAKSNTTNERVHYSNFFFILFYFGILLSTAFIDFIKPTSFAKQNIIFGIIYLLIATLVLNNKKMWYNFHIDGIKKNHSDTLKHIWTEKKWTIIRLNAFITFMASLNAFLFSTMSFYLTYSLNYSQQIVFYIQYLIGFSAICGTLLGGVFHKSIGRKFHLTTGLVIKFLLIILFNSFIKHEYGTTIVLSCFIAICVGTMISKILLILNSIFNYNQRLFGIAITYNVSFSLMFGLVGFITMMLINHYHNLYMPSLIMLTFSYISLVALWFTPNQDFFQYLKVS